MERANLNIRARVDAQDKKLAAQDIKISSLEDRVSSLTSTLDAYKLVRNRFISTFRRDKLANTTEADRKIIAEGHGWAHGGDAVVDAQLYQGTGGRRDTITFKTLYGMSPGDVRMISEFFCYSDKMLRLTPSGHQPTIDALNMHAKIAASNDQTGSDEFYTRFTKFIQLLEESDYDEAYLEEGNLTDVTRAYRAFIECIKDEVRRVDAVEVRDQPNVFAFGE